jgi:hypothetical protein
MKRVKTVIANVRSFWANPQQRKTITWIIGAFSVALIAFGAYQLIIGYRDYNDLTEQLDDITAQIDNFISDYPLVERDGEMVRDLTDASETDTQYLALLHTRERTIHNDRVDAENQRNGGMRLIGIGLIGLALAYLVLPETKPQSEPTDMADTTPDAPLQKPTSEEKD